MYVQSMVNGSAKRTASDARRLARYRLLRDLGFHWLECRAGMRRIEQFRRLVTSRGIDPDSYGDCARDQGHGGWPKKPVTCRTPEAAEARRRRYWALREMGANAYQASEGMGCEMAFRRVKRELTGSPFKTAWPSSGAV